MYRLSSAAPQIGAALAAGLMVMSAMAFQLGSGQLPAQRIDGDIAEPVEQVQTASNALDLALIPSELDQSEVPDAIFSVSEPVVVPDPELVIQSSAPRLAIIVDDIADLETAETLWDLRVPITLSVLPYSTEAQHIAERANGRELFVHLPMEPIGLQDPGPLALTHTLGTGGLSARAQWAMDQVPGARGFNNHMGSRLTRDEQAMSDVFAALEGRQRDLVFVDSLTHPDSVAREVAERAGFTALDRNVFLDHESDLASINRQIDEALRLAQQSGFAIAIGHPRPETIEALQSLQARASDAGVEIVTVSEVVSP